MSTSSHVNAPHLPAGRFAEANLLIAFTDLTAYTVTTRKLGNWDTASLVQGVYERSAAIVEEGGGRIVKFIGDAALIVFPEEKADRGIVTLLRYKSELDAWLASIGYPGHVVVKAHLGTVIAGSFGGARDARYDVIGADVNLTATLDSRGFAITAQAFRALSAETRKHFKKHTPPITYIPLQQAH